MGGGAAASQAFSHMSEMPVTSWTAARSRRWLAGCYIILVTSNMHIASSGRRPLLHAAMSLIVASYVIATSYNNNNNSC